MLRDSEVIDKACSFMKDSASYFGTQRTRMQRDWEAYSGNFWDQNAIKEWHREKRPCEVWNVNRVFVNAISSPFSSSPYHIQIENRSTKELEDLQKFIDDFEARNDSKNAIIESIANAAVSGEGYLTVSIIDVSEDEQKIQLEVIDDPSLVAMDPACTTTSGEDAEMGAIINLININKAKRIYGDDIVGMGWPEVVPPICATGMTKIFPDKIPVVNFYYKEDNGKVVFAKICGQKVIEHKEMPYSTIPIFRFTGYKSKDADHKTEYLGVVRTTWSLQVGANIGFSTLMERMNRNPKGSFLMPVEAIENLEKYYQMAGSDESLLYLYNGSVPPTPIKESFETQDLINTINQSLQLMSNVLGIPLSGINGIDLTKKTATEVLMQEVNSESNVACFYTSAYSAIRALGKTLIEMNGFNGDIVFSLQNGPSVITQNAKKRQELSMLSGMLPDNMKPILAKYMADTFDDTVAKNLGQDIIANMDPSLKIVSNTDMDPEAVHILNGMKQSMDTAMNELLKAKTENQELKKQLDMMNLQVMNLKGQRELDWQKFQVQEQNKVRLEEAKLMAQGVEIDNKAKAESEKNINEGKKIAIQAQKVQNDAVNTAIKDINSIPPYGGV